MKLIKKDDNSDPITYSSFWWIPGWIYLLSELEGTSEYGNLVIFYLVVSFLAWFFYFYQVKK